MTLEPFGKDHATRGGSYDTGVRIVREIFDAEPPERSRGGAGPGPRRAGNRPTEYFAR